MDRTEHWDRIYERRSPRRGQLVRAHADDLDAACSPSGDGGARTLLDVGGGASTLVDEALELGLHRIAVLDVSKRALDTSSGTPRLEG